MNLTRRELLTMTAMLGLAGCGASPADPVEEDSEIEEEAAEEPQAAEPEEDEPVYDEDKLLAVFRCDIRHGVLGDWESYTLNSVDFSDSYALVSADGNLNFCVNGVVFNGECSLGEETTTYYSGQSDYPARRVLINGDKYGNVGNVDFEVFKADDYLLIDMVTQEDTDEHKGTLFENFYLWEQLEDSAEE